MKYENWSSGRLREICELWNKELGGHFPMREELLLQNSIRDVNVLQMGSRLAIDESTDRVVGFIVAKAWQEKAAPPAPAGAGWIQVLLVDSAYRGRGIGSELLRGAEQALIKYGVTKILLGRDPWHYFPGIPKEYPVTREWFEAKGYRNDRRTESDLLNTYGPDLREDLPAFADAEFRLLREGESGALLAFLRRCFPGRWEYEAVQYFERGGKGREFVVAVKEGQIIGFCRINDAHSPFIAQNVYWAPLFADGLGGIGPLGIDSAFRGSGYGLAVVQAGIHFLRQRGIRSIVIDWTTLVSFYGKLNYRVWKSYESYSKPLV
ncbi:GNAT family N-acetyltransferase [Paenibacillus beijingensis]|uniref:Acetyltransferase n=1 Tax=Paenibacillus beijingensis TaxID=1126833 RepID=A0A0D5NIF2_9BACL|nr:GNAT family N-acetyltransferase [Paenibacillus beijingensis]AJY74752.1 acetyltransferase [Paenibacillus beijingensis]